ncbi:MAG: ABC transporter ATP-binding protein [Halobacteriaceae archaeon]
MGTAGTEDDELADVRADEDRALGGLILEYGRAQLPEFVVGGVASIVSRALNLLPALVFGVAIDAIVTDQGPFTLPLFPAAWVPATDWGQFWLATGLIGGAYVVGAGLGWVNSWAWNHFAQHLQHDVRVDTYDAMQRLELSFFDNKQTGEVMSVLNNDVNRLEQFLTNSLNALIRIVVRVGGIAVLMLYLNWKLAVVSLLSVPVLATASWLFVNAIHPKYQEVRSSVGRLNSRLENNIGGIEVIKSYTTEPFEADRVDDASQEYLDANWDAITTRIKFFPSLQLITGAGFVATFVAGGLWAVFPTRMPIENTLSLGTLTTFLLYSRRFMWPMRQLGQIVNNYQYAEAAAERIRGLLAASDRMEGTEDGQPIGDIDGDVEYENVTFTYEGEDDPTLEMVSFSAEPGQLVGLVGPTGAGKTTLIKLLLRLYEVDSGEIRIDDTPISSVSVRSLREHVGYVSQDPFLFHGTVRENIAYGDPEISDDAIEDAARVAGVHEFVSELPEGYETMVGERGVKLSGGQRQRVSIARAVLTDPDILVLDEATSHVDNETEMLIQDSLDTLIEDRTAFAIAHRLSTVRNADKILVLDAGEIVERGTHEDLLAEDGLYANLWSVQVGQVESLPEEFVERAARRRAAAMDVQGSDD